MQPSFHKQISLVALTFSQKGNSAEAAKSELYLCVKFEKFDGWLKESNELQIVDCSLPVSKRVCVVCYNIPKKGTTICDQYALRGYCNSKNCQRSHDLDLFLDIEMARD